MSESITEIQDTCSRTLEFCRQFLAIAKKKLTGTLLITNTDGETKGFLCRGGTIADLDTGREETLLTDVMLSCESVTPKHLKKAQKQAEKSGASLGAALIEMDVVPEEELVHAIEEGVTQEVTEAFGWEVDQSSFRSHDEDEKVEGFLSDLSDYFDLLADPETLFLEAAQRMERWDMVQESYGMLLDVFYATPGTFSYFREPETYPTEIRILGSIDGTRDIEEVIADSGLDPFTAIEFSRSLVRNGAIELINPVQMFQLGNQADSAGNLEKASKLYRGAIERGLNDFDIGLKLAQSLEAQGKKKEAAACYFDFCNKCLSQLRIDDAIRSLRRVVKISPEQSEPTLKLLDLLIQHNRLDEAFDMAITQANRVANDEEAQLILDLLLKLREAGARDIKLHEKIIQLATRVQDLDLVRQEKELVAKNFHDRRDTADALKSYQKIFVEGDDSLEVRLKLVDLHREQGNRQKAIDHINSLLNLGGRNRVTDLDVLIKLHEMMRELLPADIRSNRFLVDHYQKLDELENAVEVMKAWLPELEKTGNSKELARAFEQLISMEDRSEYRWSLVAVQEKLGEEAEARYQLRQLAHHAMRRREFDQAAKALEHILKSRPLDIETRKSQAELFDLRGEKELAAETLLELATLEIIAGHIQEAEGYCRQVLITRPDDAEVVDKFGKLCLELGDKQKAVEQFVKAAKIHLDSKNYGLARRAIDRLLKAHPQHGEGRSLLDRLEALEAPPPAVSAAPAHRAPEPTAKTPSSSTNISKPIPSIREPFQGPAAVKTTVSGITAKLRNLKAGGNSEKKAIKATQAVGDIAARLKSLSMNSTGGAAPASGDSASNGEAAPRGSSGNGDKPKAALKSAAARLKALSSGKKDSKPMATASSTTEASTTEAPVADAATPSPSIESDGLPNVGNVPADPDTTEVFSEAAEAVNRAIAGGKMANAPKLPDSAAPATSSDATTADGAAPGAAPPTAKIKQKLGGSASRLAALRKAATT